MTNNEILIYIYKNIDIKKFILKVINQSTIQNREDLTQYIYLYLLEYDNEKLNILYEKNILPQFIMKIILNQRNYYKSYYNEYCKNNYNLEETDIDYEHKDTYLDSVEKNRKLDFIDNELNCDNSNINKNDEYLRYKIYKIYLTKKYTLKELSYKYNISYNTLFRLIKETKKIINLKYDKYIHNSIDNKYNE